MPVLSESDKMGIVDFIRAAPQREVVEGEAPQARQEALLGARLGDLDDVADEIVRAMREAAK